MTSNYGRHDENLCGEDRLTLKPDEHFDGHPHGHADDAQTLASDSLEATRDLLPGEATGPVIGNYRLMQRIGVGGMGEVWLAEQKVPIRRRVAIKLIKVGMDSREVIARFESERQTLALMDHPAIAKVLDAGSTAQGAPYFVMEYVAGVSITKYCDNHRLGTGERLQLFIRVCEGVQHAHHKAVIHRDIKPSNILVAEVDGHPVPKIIDFGVAKALTNRLINETMFTRVGTLVGTPEYVSPEQALSSGEDIDTRTDVYSLGIVLYELLTGAVPLNMKDTPLDEFLRRLREDEAPRPSTRFRTQDATTSTELARKRQSEPITLANQIKGDLDSIVLKAVDKDRARRYSSPSDFAADVGRYLRNETVLAVPYSATYRARKFARRHRFPLALLAAFILVLIAASTISIRQSIMARHQRDRADLEAANAKAVNQFLEDDLLSSANPADQGGADTKPDPDIKVRTVLDRAASQAQKRFADKPLVESELQLTIGNAYQGLGLRTEAEEHIRRAYELSKAHRGADDPDTLNLLMQVSSVQADLGKNAEAIDTAKLALDGYTRRLGPNDSRTVIAAQNLGALYLYVERFADAEPLLKSALAIQTARNGYDNIDTLNTSDSLAQLYILQSRYSEALPLMEKGLDSYRRVFGPDHPYTHREMYGMAKVVLGEGNFPEAEKQFSAILAAELPLKGPRHPDVFASEQSRADAQLGEGKFDEAISGFEATLQNSQQAFGPKSPETLDIQANLAMANDFKGDLPRAEKIWQNTLQSFRSLGKDQEASAVNTEELLGQNLIHQHKYAQAEPLLRDAVAFREKQNADNWHRFRAQAFLGAALSGLQKYSEAEPLLLAGYDGLEKHSARMPALHRRWIRFTGEQIIDMYQRWPKPDQASAWKAKLPQ
jgi:non-specific serine/threonine protein kinase/serine/threonine-protein kinase